MTYSELKAKQAKGLRSTNPTIRDYYRSLHFAARLAQARRAA